MAKHPWQVAQPIATDGDVEALAACMHALGSPRRLQVVRALAKEGPLRRRRLAQVVDGDPHSVLEVLEHAGIVERVWDQGDRIEWRLVDGAVERIGQMLITCS